ncbi:sensor histidine kinase [Nocardioides endophyticus]|uniref:sensor histidine kinase n=1 Tax=Nocardioides endophyticus TaxID=1353775 RepID=UPI0031E4EE7D
MGATPENPDLWRLTLQHSPIGMALVGLDGRLLMVNRAMSEMLGYDVEELQQRGFQELTHVDDLDADLVQFDRALAGEIDSYRLRKRYLHADGHVAWGDLSVALVRGRDGRPLHFISQILDVTEQHEHEDRLRAATADVEHERQSLEAVFETVSVGLLLIGRDGRYERMNRRHQETMRLPFPDGHGGEAGQLGHVYHPDGKTLMAKEDMPSYRAAQGEEFDDYTYWVGDDPITRAAFSVSARQVRGPSGERLGAALAYQEITDLMRAMQVKDEFVSSVSHELRTPLTSVLGYLELLAENDKMPADAVAHVQVIRRNATRLQTLLSDLLQVGQVAEVSLQLQRADADLVAVAREAVEAARLYADQSGVGVELDVPHRLLTLVDAQRIRQVLDNLLSNAVKYSRAGGTVTVCLREAADGIVLEVSDTGMGIAADEIDQVFGRFFRGGEALRQQIPGTGLGLNIVSSIVAAHGGEVTVDSELGRGTTFRATLPHVTD